jgi:hypothetical protein
MKYKKEHLQELAQQVLSKVNEPFVQTGLLFLSMVTQNSPEECLVKIKQIKEGTFKYEI